MLCRVKLWTGCVKCRFLSTAEVSTALRPFYFTVHPDLFGKFPEQQRVNEDSLKQLSALLEAQQASNRVSVQPLSFYVRQKNVPEGNFKLVRINLSGSNVRDSVVRILRACEMPTEYVDKIPHSNETSKVNLKFKNADEFSEKYNKYKDNFSQAAQMKRDVEKAKAVEDIHAWIHENSAPARNKYESTKATRDQVQSLTDHLCHTYGIKHVKWESGWNVSHIRGMLQSLVAMASQHSHHMSNLKGRVLALGQFTGVSLDGDVYLSIVEVRNAWLDNIKNVHQQDGPLEAIPQYEKTLSNVLRDIHIRRRKFMPKVSAVQYCNHLRQLTTSMGDFYGSGRNFPASVPKSLSRYEIVVEPEAGPLMLSPTGQFITPSSCPAGELVGYVATRLDEAVQLLTEYNINKHVEKALHKEVKERFNLLDLQKDDSVTPALMILCCQRLLTRIPLISTKLQGNILFITNYYSVLSDGVLCIPWNFK